MTDQMKLMLLKKLKEPKKLKKLRIRKILKQFWRRKKRIIRKMTQ